MDPFGLDETTTRLKTAVDLRDFRDPNAEGVEFEVDEEDVRKEGETEPDTDLRCFDRRKVADNLCLLSDHEDDNEDDEEEFHKERLKKRILNTPGGDISPNEDGKVLKEIKSVGVGPLVPQGALVVFHYNAYIDVGESPFDSSRLRNEYEKKRLGKGQLIQGLEIAILSMKKKESARFLIHSDYAFGKMGCPPRIPAEMSLIYDVEIMYFIEQDGVDDYTSMTEEERRKCPFDIMEKTVKAVNEEAKQHFSMKAYSRALQKYTTSEKILSNYHLKNDEEEKCMKKLLVRVLINIAQCNSKLSPRQDNRVITYCNRVLELDNNFAKALYLKGKALTSKGEYEEAEKWLKKARKITPTDSFVNKALIDLGKKKKDYDVFLKGMCGKMFSKPTGAADSAGDGKEKTATQNACSQNFQNLVNDQLENFVQDSSQQEWKFPNFSLNEAEIYYILEKSESLGLDVRSRGTGNERTYEVFKKN